MKSVRVAVTTKLPGHLSLDDRDTLVERVRETAFPSLAPDGRTLNVEWTAETEWVLRGMVEETMEIIDSEFQVRLYALDLDALMPWPVDE